MLRKLPIIFLVISAFISAATPVSAPSENVLVNGGFEGGLTGWNVYASPEIVSPGAGGSASAVRIVNQFDGSYIYQFHAAFPLAEELLVLRFSARVTGGFKDTGPNVILTTSDWPNCPCTNALVVEFREGSVFLWARNTGSTIPALMPHDGGWHEYEADYDPVSFEGKLFIDGVLATSVTGDSINELRAQSVLFAGDVLCCDRLGPSPNVDYDNIEILSVAPKALVGLGDSVAAGYGLGPADGLEDGLANSHLAYPALLSKALGFREFNLAISGACAVTAGSPGAHLWTPDTCKTSVLGNQMPLLPASAEVVTLTVGGNDIQFSECMARFFGGDDDACRPCPPFLFFLQERAPCDDDFDRRLRAFAANLRVVLQTLAAPAAPRVVLTEYYNPFPPPVGELCDVWVPAAIARNHGLAKDDPNSTEFRAAVKLVQAQGGARAAEIVDVLNRVIRETASLYGMDTVDLLGPFSDHDMCRGARGGTIHDTWVYGPRWSYHFWPMGSSIWGWQERSVASESMPSNCLYPAQESPVTWHSSSLYLPFYSFSLEFVVNCMPHPTSEGQQAIANVILSLLREGPPRIV